MVPRGARVPKLSGVGHAACVAEVRMPELRGRVAIVTGASSGVGWQSAVRLAREGMRLCVTARREKPLAELSERIRDAGGECVAATGDVTSQDDVERVVRTCVERYGGVDLLVNDAAVQAYAFFERYPWEQIERVFDVSVFGYMRFARAVLPHFRRAGRGHVLNVASMLSVGGAPLLSAYSAAKHAVLGWSRSLRLELRGTGIDDSSILLPSVSTPMFDHATTMLGLAPRPVPPTYDTEVAARAVVRVARRPRAQYVPVFLQGRLLLWLQAWAPFVGEAILGRFGARMQTAEAPAVRTSGNLFEPVEAGAGPYGSVPPTPAWKRAGVAAALLGSLGAAGYGAVRGLRSI